VKNLDYNCKGEKMSSILDQWNEIKTLIESLDLDVVKNANGNASAGVRARRGLRLLKTKSADLVKATISEEKARKS
tara:strand:- start:129 stop:356 length:228 start_codon:yes stop_codon:yes gene_type:complete